MSVTSPAPRSVVLERGAGDSAVELTTLPGGLRVVTESIPGSRSAAVGVWVGVGSADEVPSLAGASHYLEHVLFKGTSRRTANQISQAIDAVGGDLNAFTAHEFTCYYAYVLASDAPLAIDVVCDVVTAAEIRTADVDTERLVIVDEIAMRQDDPDDYLAEAFAARIFAGHPAARPVSGSADSVMALTRDQIHGYYRRRYQPESMVIAVAGGVHHDDIVRYVRESFSGLLSGDAHPAARRQGPHVAMAAPTFGVETKDTEQAQIALGVPALPRHDAGRYSLAVLSTIVGGGMSSRLFQTVREQHGLAYNCYTAISAYASAGAWSVYTACRPDNVDTVVGLIRRELADIARLGVTADELAVAQGQLCSGTELSLEGSDARMTRLGRRLLTAPSYVPLHQELAALRSVTLDDVMTMARRLLSRPLTVQVTGPFDQQSSVSQQLSLAATEPLWQ